MAAQMAAKTIDMRACLRAEEKCVKMVEQKTELNVVVMVGIRLCRWLSTCLK